jgi:hypothetical protein
VTIGGGSGAGSPAAEIGEGGASGTGAAIFGGVGALSGVGENGIDGGSNLGGALSTAGGGGEGGLGARICVRNSVKEACFDAGWAGVDSGEIGSSNVSSQRRIWSRE